MAWTRNPLRWLTAPFLMLYGFAVLGVCALMFFTAWGRHLMRRLVPDIQPQVAKSIADYYKLP